MRSGMRKGDVILFVSRVTANNEVREALKNALEQFEEAEALAKFTTLYHSTPAEVHNVPMFAAHIFDVCEVAVATAKRRNNIEDEEDEAAKLTLATVVKREIYNEYQNIYYWNKWDGLYYVNVAEIFRLFSQISQQEELSRFAKRLYKIATDVNSMLSNSNSYFLKFLEHQYSGYSGVANDDLKKVNLFAQMLAHATHTSVSKVYSALSAENIEKICRFDNFKGGCVATDELGNYLEKFTTLAADIHL